MKKISVIITTYNASQYIDICLEHLINQTIGLDNIEIILVDDASTDDGKTLAKLQKYEQQYSDNIILICNDKNLKPGGCRNLAIQYASGEYIAYCDADDWLSFDALEILYNIAKYYDCDVVEFGHTKTYSYDGICTKNHSAPSYNPNFNIEDFPGKLYSLESEEARKQFILPSDSPVIACNKIYKRQLLQKHNIVFQENAFYEEPPFSHMVRLYANKYFILPITLYYYYIHNDSSSHTFVSRRLDMTKAYDTYIENVKKTDLFLKYKDEIEYIYWNGCFFLPLFNSASIDQFHTIDELNTIHHNARRAIGDIRANKYFIEQFSNLKIIGELIYIDVNADNYKDFYELFYLISH